MTLTSEALITPKKLLPPGRSQIGGFAWRGQPGVPAKDIPFIPYFDLYVLPDDLWLREGAKTFQAGNDNLENIDAPMGRLNVNPLQKLLIQA
jgi:hypothetical protein